MLITKVKCMTARINQKQKSTVKMDKQKNRKKKKHSELKIAYDFRQIRY